jgi:CubicO group peptidase (beta-lactamase class C family)
MVRTGGNGILPAEWIQDIRRGGDGEAWKKGDFCHLFPNGSYRSQWYQTGGASGSFCGIGIHGQWLWIDPLREIVIAKVSAQEEPVSDDIDVTLIRAFEAITEALR